MNSRDAINLLAQNGRRSILWEGLNRRDREDPLQEILPVDPMRPLPGSDFDGQKTDKTGGSRTDYRGKPDLSDLPMSVRRRAMTSDDPGPQREIKPSTLPPSRNVGNAVWRRYANGTLDERDAVSKLREAMRKYRTGVPINEGDALVISSVYPEYRFQNVGPDIVRIKAWLSDDEVRGLRKWSEELDQEAALRAIVDLGGA